MDYLTCSSCKRSKPAAEFSDTGYRYLKTCSACRAKDSRWRVRATVQDESHSPPAKRTCVRPPLGALSPNVRFNRLEEETEQDKQTRRVAEAKDKTAQARQRARKRGDILTPTPSERVKQFEQPEQLCSRCHCPRSPNQFRSSQQESPAAATTTCQECRRTKNRVRDNPLQTPVRNNSEPVRTPFNSQSTPSSGQAAVPTSFDSQSTPSVSQTADVAPPSLHDPAISEEYWGYISDFYEKVAQLQQDECVRCNEKWFDMKLSSERICKRCVARERSEKCPLFTERNCLHVGSIPEHLSELTQSEEHLIARLHVHIQVWQIKGQQFRYKSLVITFMQNTAKVYYKLPLLPSDLNILLLKPSGQSNQGIEQRFNSLMRARRKVVFD